MKSGPNQNLILNFMKKTLLLFIWTIAVLSPPLLLAQERSISGRVTSADDGAPIPGVNIIIKGTTIGTVTDIDGNYKLSILQEGAVLVFTYIGMTPQEIEVGAQLVINIAMKQDVTQLTEIVVTAVGIQREARALGYSVENITGDKLKVGSEPDPLRELQGKVPGVKLLGIEDGVIDIANQRRQLLSIVHGYGSRIK